MIDNHTTLFMRHFEAVAISKFHKNRRCDWLEMGTRDELKNTSNVV